MLDCEGNTSNAMKYLELGVYPIRFELMKRSVLFLQYILKQDKSSMLYKVLQATWENPIKNDFVNMCKKYLGILDISLSFTEIEKTSQWSFKKLVKAKTEVAGPKYLLEQKANQTKSMEIKYENLSLQEYFTGGYCSKKISKLIFKARSKTLDIKTQQKWKYADTSCIGCKIKEESGNELLLCEKLNYQNRMAKSQVKYDWFFSKDVSDVVKAGQTMQIGLKERDKIIESGIT